MKNPTPLVISPLKPSRNRSASREYKCFQLPIRFGLLATVVGVLVLTSIGTRSAKLDNLTMLPASLNWSGFAGNSLRGSRVIQQTRPPEPIRNFQGLRSITFWERTGSAPLSTTFSPNEQLLDGRRTNLGSSGSDFTGASTEYYDIFYSEADGTPNRDGAYVSIEAVWAFAFPVGGGLNIAEVQLNFESGSTVFGNTVTSYVGLGDNFISASVPNAADGNLQTHTTMGNTIGQTQRLRVTIGFPNPPLTINTPSPLPDAIPGQPYETRLEASGGIPPYTWSGTLPGGFGLSFTSDGLIRGDAIDVVTAFAFDATVTDAGGARAFKNFELRVRYPCPPTDPPCLLIDDVQVSEGDAGTVAAVIPVRLSRPSPVPVTVVVSTQDFTATAPNDYTTRVGPITIDRGEIRTTVAIPVNGDTLYEAHEQFYVNLANPVNASIGKARGICTISDNDPASFGVCSSDVPKVADQGGLNSTLTVERDQLIDDVEVSLFIGGHPLSGRTPGWVKVFAPESVEISLLSTLVSDIEGRVGGGLGSTCSPTPNCIFDFDALEGIDLERTISPRIGVFRPDSEWFNRRMNARGTWTLNADAGQLNCWCVKLDLPREGCRLSPEHATVPIFSFHRVRAILTSGGARAANQLVAFTVRGGGGEIRFQEDVVSDSTGVAVLFYYDFSPGVNNIEARTVINGVPSIASANVTWVADGLSGFDFCPFGTLTRGTPGGETSLKTARSFRDGVLSQSARGRTYTQLYYQFSTEAVQILMFNPMLMLRSREFIERYKPLTEAMVNGQRVEISEGDLDEIEEFLNSFAAKGSSELQDAVKAVSRDLRDPQVHSEFGITVTQGQKRELQSGILHSIKRIGRLGTLFGLGALVIFVATGKRLKSLRRHAAPLLVALLSFALVTNNNGLWSVATNRSATQTNQLSGADSNSFASHQPAHPSITGPIAFESNNGQTDPQVKFVSRGRDYTMFLTPTEAVLSLRRPTSQYNTQTSELLQPTTDRQQTAADVVRMKLIGANSEPRMTGLDQLPVSSNYYVGNDPAKWRAGNTSYAKVQYEDVYAGVNLLYYGNQGQLEYDFVVAPGADPRIIAMNFNGAEQIDVDAAGDLVLSSEGQLRQRKPIIYQDVDGQKRFIEGRYVIHGESRSEVSFDIGTYDSSRPLIIDPVLQYSTFLGGSKDDEGNAITVDDAGNVYIIGLTDSLNFPTANASQPAFGGGAQDAFVAKLDPSGTQLIYSTYIGGNGADNGSAIAVDTAGNAYITGFTGSTNFPVINAFQTANRGKSNAFVAKLGPTGGLLYSTHLGGSLGDFGSSIAVDSSGNVYVTGVATSPNFPTLGPVQPFFGGMSDAYIAKLNSTGNQLVYSSYLGGVGDDGATSIAVDSTGNVYLTGLTTSPNFRTASPLQTAHGGGALDAFVTKLNSAGTELVYSTYLGGSREDRGLRLTVDSAGNAYVTGDTDSLNFPTRNALQQRNGGGLDAFVVKLSPTGAALTYSTYLGGSSADGGTAISVDSTGSGYVTGFTGSANFPAVTPLQQIMAGGPFDGFVIKLNPAGSALDYSTFLGGNGIDSGFGIAVDSSGNAYVMGVTNSVDFPTVAPMQTALGGGPSDLFVARIASSGLSITRAEIQAKHLFVFGSGFAAGAKILIDRQVHPKTRNDELNPTGVLFGKKAGPKIAPGQTVTLQVRNPDGAMSNPLQFSRP